jgi:hypothetical protein
LSSADGDANAAAIASIAASDSLGSVETCARCLSEKRARKRMGRGVVSEQRDWRRERMVEVGVSGVSAEGAILKTSVRKRWIGGIVKGES